MQIHAISTKAIYDNNKAF